VANNAIDGLIPIITNAPVDDRTRGGWLEQLWLSEEQDDIPNIELHPKYWGALCRTQELDAAESGLPSSIGEFGWNGAAKTFFWIDPRQELIGIMVSQYMAGFDQPEKDFQGMTYQAPRPERKGRSE